MRKPPVVLLSGVRWSFLWQRHHALATLFARAGYPTTFVETTGLSNPKLDAGSLRNVLARLSRPGEIGVHEKNLSVYSPLVLPPTGEPFRRANEKYLLPKVVRDLRERLDEAPLVVAYPPTRTTLDLVSRLEPRLVFYDCSEEYSAFPGAPRDIAATERELLRRADLVSCTSGPLLERVRRFRPDAFLSGPGVDFDLFGPLRREKPGERPDGERRVVCYFGDLDRKRLHLDVLEEVARSGFEVRVVGRVEKRDAFCGVDRRGEVSHPDLPKALAGTSAFVLPYRINHLTRGISPAKTYECLATGRPVIASPLPAMERLGGHVYFAEEPREYVEALRKLDVLETQEKARARVEVARRNSWEERFSEIEERVWRALG